MRVVIVGAGSLGVAAARNLLARGHDVVIVDRSDEAIELAAGELECGFLHGDGSRPGVLQQADPANADALLCLTDDDQTNIIASLVGRSLGFRRVVTRIGSEEFEHVCIELELHDTVVPSRTIGRHLADMVEGQDILELTSVIKGDARTFLFVARDEHAGPVAELPLPPETRVSHLYRDGKFVPVEEGTEVRAGDEVAVIAHRKHTAALLDRFAKP